MGAISSDFGNKHLSSEEISEMERHLFPESFENCLDCDGKGYKSFKEFECSKCNGKGLLRRPILNQ